MSELSRAKFQLEYEKSRRCSKHLGIGKGVGWRLRFLFWLFALHQSIDGIWLDYCWLRLVSCCFCCCGGGHCFGCGRTESEILPIKAERDRLQSEKQMKDRIIDDLRKEQQVAVVARGGCDGWDGYTFCVYVYMHTYVYICIHTYTHIYIYIHISCICTCIRICTCTCICICTCVCICICKCICIYIYVYVYVHVYAYVYACGPKTVPVKRAFLNIAIVGWGGVGGHVNVPCTSYMIYCHAAKISGIIYYVTCCYAAEISGIVYYVTYMLLRCWDLWDRVLRYIHVATLLRSLVSFTTLHTCCYAAEISGIVYYVTHMLLRCWDLWYRLLRYMLLRCWDLWDRLLRYMSLRCWDLWDRLLRYIHVATLLRSLRSLRAWQWRCIHKNADCQLFTTHALQRWRWKTKNRAPSFSRISNHQISTALW